MRVSRSLLLVIVFSITLLGCASVQRSIANYEACKADPGCLHEMESARSTTYTITKAAAGPLAPTPQEILAWLVSNAAAFGVGMWKGRKVKKG